VACALAKSGQTTNVFERHQTVGKVVGQGWLKAFGWDLVGELPDVKQAVLIAAPHTSNWDLPFGLAAAWGLGMSTSWIGKHTLFKFPQGVVMRALGGVPVDRRQHANQVQAAVDLFKEHERMFLMVAPEGTRSRTDRWKTGFYWIAHGANVPIICAFLDYKKKRGGIGPVIYPSGDIDSDMPNIRQFYSDISGKYGERMTNVDSLTEKMRAADKGK
jgi:1-acyl-sn-glycerol-3-phosphate acyltransferase